MFLVVAQAFPLGAGFELDAALADHLAGFGDAGTVGGNGVVIGSMGAGDGKAAQGSQQDAGWALGHVR